MISHGGKWLHLLQDLHISLSFNTGKTVLLLLLLSCSFSFLTCHEFLVRSLNLISPTVPLISILWFCTVGNFQERLCHIKADLTAFSRTTDKTCVILQGWGWGQGLWGSSRDGPKGSGSTEGPGAWFWVVSLWSYLTWSSSPPSAFHPLFCRVLGTMTPGSSPESACRVGARQAGRDTRRARPRVKLGLTAPPPSGGWGAVASWSHRSVMTEVWIYLLKGWFHHKFDWTWPQKWLPS